jgi:hypothetical protein
MASVAAEEDGDERRDVDAQRRDDDQHQQQREDHAHGVAHERPQRNIDTAVFQRQVEQPDDAPQDPAADEIDRQREEDFQQYPDRLGEEVLQYGLEIEVRNFMDGLREMGFLHTVGQHQRRGRLGS